MTPTRLQQFAEAYAPAVMAAAGELKPYSSGRTLEEYALDTTLAMLAQIEGAGVHGIEHYEINTRGGAFRLTCSALGVVPGAVTHSAGRAIPAGSIATHSRALQDFLDGGM